MTITQEWEARGFTVAGSLRDEYGRFAGLRLRCDRCDAATINGVPCHEFGCPNAPGECRECGADVPKRGRICEDCANPPEDDLPLCVQVMRCWCAGHARGNPYDRPCDARE